MPRPAKEPFNGTGNTTIKFNGAYDELFIINDGSTDLVFTAGFFTFTMKPGETFNEEINTFNSVKITGTGAFRGYVREDS